MFNIFENLFNEYHSGIIDRNECEIRFKEMNDRIDESKTQSIEELAHRLNMRLGERGIQNGTDKTKWREVIMADMLGHVVHSKISSGKNSEGYGSDAFIPPSPNRTTRRLVEKSLGVEYKSQVLTTKQIKNLRGEVKKLKNGSSHTYTPLTIRGVYNGFNSNYEVANQKYSEIQHYFGLFYQERVVLIIKVDTDYVIESLNRNYQKWLEGQKTGNRKTTNLNTVSVNLGDTHLYEVAWKDESFFV
jgi:hypothetical protein